MLNVSTNNKGESIYEDDTITDENIYYNNQTSNITVSNATNFIQSVSITNSSYTDGLTIDTTDTANTGTLKFNNQGVNKWKIYGDENYFRFSNDSSAQLLIGTSQSHLYNSFLQLQNGLTVLNNTTYTEDLETSKPITTTINRTTYEEGLNLDTSGSTGSNYTPQMALYQDGTKKWSIYGIDNGVIEAFDIYKHHGTEGTGTILRLGKLNSIIYSSLSIQGTTYLSDTSLSSNTLTFSNNGYTTTFQQVNNQLQVNYTGDNEIDFNSGYLHSITQLDATTIQENGTTLTNKYLAKSGGTMTGTITFSNAGYTSTIKESNGELYIDTASTGLQVKQPTANLLQLRTGGSIIYSDLTLFNSDLTCSTVNATTFNENGTALSSKYLKIDGTNTMSGDLDMGAENIYIGTSNYLYLGGTTATANYIRCASTDNLYIHSETDLILKGNSTERISISDKIYILNDTELSSTGKASFDEGFYCSNTSPNTYFDMIGSQNRVYMSGNSSTNALVLEERAKGSTAIGFKMRGYNATTNGSGEALEDKMYITTSNGSNTTVYIHGDGNIYIDSDTGTNTFSTSFTGTHDIFHLEEIGEEHFGKLVHIDELLGFNIDQTDAKFKFVSEEKCKSVYGILKEMKRSKKTDEDGNFLNHILYFYGNYIKYKANGLGEGGIYVCNKKGSITKGDYLQSSSVAGFAEKQDDDLYHNYTVAKANYDMDFININPLLTLKYVDTYGNWILEEEYDETIHYKVALIPCIYLCS